MKKVKWAVVPIFKNYNVSNDGQVYSNYKNELKSLRKDKDGYLICDLYGEGKHSTCKIHRLVAQSFCDNDDNHPIVDHINGDKSDNHYTNLRWVNYSTNNTNRHVCKGESGLVGIVKRNRLNPWQAYITKDGSFKSLGHFKTKEDALFARESELIKRGIRYETR